MVGLVESKDEMKEQALMTGIMNVLRHPGVDTGVGYGL
jgi:hypothetical protein